MAARRQSRSDAKCSGIFAVVGVIAESALVNIASGSSESTTRFEQTSAMPRPMALPCEAGRQAAHVDGADVGAAAGARQTVDAAADDVGVHAGAADVLADVVDDEDVDAVERKRRHQGARFGEQGAFAGRDRGGGHHFQSRHLMVAVFDERDAGHHLQRTQHRLRDFEQDLFEAEAHAPRDDRRRPLPICRSRSRTSSAGRSGSPCSRSRCAA